MFEMTTEERAAFDNKIAALINFYKIFDTNGNLSQNWLFDNLCSSFTLKEVVNPDFLKMMETANFSRSHYYTVFSSMTRRDNLPKLTREETEFIFKTYLREYINSGDFNSYSCNLLRVILNVFNSFNHNKDGTHNYSNLEILKFIMESDEFKTIRESSSVELKEHLDDIFAKGSITNEEVEELINFVRVNFPNYNNFALIVQNNNVSEDIKLSVLRSSFRKKDFPSIKTFFRDNITDMNHLNLFIEATIIQNNRIKDKDASILLLFKRLFLEPDAYSSNKRLRNGDSILNKDTFAKKYYKNYFSKDDFMYKFYLESQSSISSYDRKRAYRTFIEYIYNSAEVSFNQMINDMTKTRKAYEALSFLLETNNIRETIRILLQKGEDVADSTFTILLQILKYDQKTIFDLLHDIGIYALSDILCNVSNSEVKQDFLKNQYAFRLFYDAEKKTLTKTNDVINPFLGRSIGRYSIPAPKDFYRIILNIGPEDAESIQLISDDNKKFFGMSYEEFVKRQSLVRSVNNSYDYYFSAMYDDIISYAKNFYAAFGLIQSADVAKIYFNKFFAIFKDSDVVSEEFQNIMEFENDTTHNFHRNRSSYSSNSTNVSVVESSTELVKGAINSAIHLASLSGEDASEVVANLNDLCDNLKLVGNLK